MVHIYSNVGINFSHSWTFFITGTFEIFINIDTSNFSVLLKNTVPSKNLSLLLKQNRDLKYSDQFT